MVDITSVAIAIVALAFAVLGVTVPFLVQKYGQGNIQKAITIIGILVKAADQMFKGTNLGEAKLRWVEDEFSKHNMKIDLSLVRSIIESEVYKLRNGLQ